MPDLTLICMSNHLTLAELFTIISKIIDLFYREAKMETFQKFVKGMDDNVKNLITVFHDNRKRHTGRK